jgi:hypothetical protein
MLDFFWFHPDLDFLPSTSSFPLAHGACGLLREMAGDDIQFIPCAIRNGKEMICHY